MLSIRFMIRVNKIASDGLPLAHSQHLKCMVLSLLEMLAPANGRLSLEPWYM